MPDQREMKALWIATAALVMVVALGVVVVSWRIATPGLELGFGDYPSPRAIQTGIRDTNGIAIVAQGGRFDDVAKRCITGTRIQVNVLTTRWFENVANPQIKVYDKFRVSEPRFPGCTELPVPVQLTQEVTPGLWTIQGDDYLPQNGRIVHFYTEVFKVITHEEAENLGLPLGDVSDMPPSGIFVETVPTAVPPADHFASVGNMVSSPVAEEFPTSLPTRSPSPIPPTAVMPTPTLTPTLVPVIVPSLGGQQARLPAPVVVPSPIPRSTLTPTRTPTATPTARSSPKPTFTPISTPAPTHTPKPTNTVKPTETPKPTMTPRPHPTQSHRRLVPCLFQVGKVSVILGCSE